MGSALKEYYDIVRGVSEEYTDDVTVYKIMKEHPELNFMDNEEIETILKQASKIRNSKVG